MHYTPLKAYDLINDELHRDDNPDWSGYVYLNETNAKALRVLINHQLCIEAAEFLHENGQVKKCDIDDIIDDINQIPSRSKLYLELETTSIKRQHVIQENWSELLKLQDAVSDPYHAFYFTSSQKLIDASTDSSKYKTYCAISKVFSLLNDISDTKISDTEHVYIFGHALTLNFSVSESSLIHTIDTSVLEELLSKDIHNEAKTSLVKEALVRFLKNINEKERFDYLISHFNGFSTELLVSYEQFLKNYTFDKVRKEYQEKKTDYIARINKVFDDIATKTLAVPAGLWFAMNQIGTASPGNLQEAKNLATVLIAGLLVCLVLFNIWGQFSVLKAIKNEYVSLFERISNEYLDKVSLEEAQADTRSEFEKDLVDIDNAKRELDRTEDTVFVKLSLTCCLIVLIGFWVGMLTYFGINN